MFKPKINVQCAGCDAFVNKRKGITNIIKNATEANDFSLSLNRIVMVNDILCHSCLLSIYKKSLKNVFNSNKEDASPSDNELINNDPTFEIKFKSRTPKLSTPNGERQGDSPKLSTPNGESQEDSPKLSTPNGERQGTKFR